MNLLEAKVQCPYCWELLTLLVEPSAGEQQYVEDCQVCCAPMLISAQVEAGDMVFVGAEQENG